MSTIGDITERAALRAMRARGLDSPEELLAFASPEAIVAACCWWDRLTGVTPRLLAKKIREGGFQPDELEPAAPDRKLARRQEQHDRFDRVAKVFPPGSVTESHRRMQERCWPKDTDRCDGNMVVLDGEFPCVSVRCDRCAFEAAYPLRELAVLPLQPVALGQPEPPRISPVERVWPKRFDPQGHVVARLSIEGTAGPPFREEP